MGYMTEHYVEMHASSAFSFLEAASLPEGLAERAATLEMASVALLDRNGVYGAARMHTVAEEKGIKAQIGAEIVVRKTVNCGQVVVPLLVESAVGYQNLCQMITRFKMRETGKAEGAARARELEEFSEGLVCLTGGEDGPLAEALLRGGEAEGRKVVERLVGVYGRGNVYVELQRHFEREEEWRNQAAVRIARSLGLPLLATNGVKYATEVEREVMDVFTTIKHKTDLDHAGKLLTRNAERHLRSAKEMRELFGDLPEAIASTRELSAKLEFTMKDLGYQFPLYPVPEGETMDSYLAKRVEEGVRKRYGSKENRKYLERAKLQVKRELDLIGRLGFAGYFLIVWDVVMHCLKKGILIQGRGSAANSAVCYALEITAVDPISMGLLFERFLSENRGEWPDIDLDLPSGDMREEAIQYVYNRYGELGAAMTANLITYRGRSAAREVGKVLGFDQEMVGRLSGLMGQFEWKGPTDTLPHHFGHAGLDVRHPRIAKYLELCLRMQDLPRHLGQHSGGMVICQGLLDKVVPIERASMPGRTVVQWDKEDCSNMGLVKVDLLGLGMMAVLKDCIELVPQHYGVPIDLGDLPQTDEVYEVLRRGDTVGMFQVESRAQMASLPRNAPKVFYDLVVQVAIIRPGPIVGKMMHPYMRRRQNLEKVTYPHPSLEPVLKRTLGVPLFQEQLLRIAMVMADFTGAQAEELRKAVGMRRSMKRMKDLEGQLRDGMTAKGISPEVQENIVQSIASFALYGFPESHAASFALIVYASAYLKVKYLAAFTCAMLNNQPMGFYMPAVLVKDAQRHGLRVKPIDVQRSEWNCTIEHEDDETLTLRLGLRYVKGMRGATAEALVVARERSGFFRSVDELVVRVPEMNRKEMVQMARVGALNKLDGVEHRRDALWQVEAAGRPVGPLLKEASVAPVASPLRQMTTEERIVADYGGTGVTTGPHPMAYRRETLRRQRILSAAELGRRRSGEYVRAAGCVIARQRPGTASGFIFLSMEDETGIANVIIHPDLFERERVLVSRGKFLLVEGKLQNEDMVVHVRAERVYSLAVSQADVRSHDFY